MALHFDDAEFAARRARLNAALDHAGLDGLLMFAQESMFWLTGYDTFGFCFFQCLYVGTDGTTALLTRSADFRQAKHTSNLADIRVWTDAAGATPSGQLKSMLDSLGARGAKLGAEYESHGLTAANGRALDATLDGFCRLEDASQLVTRLRAVKSPAEIAYVRRAADLGDAAYDVGLAEIGPGAGEGAILAAMQGAVFAGGGDYPANEFIIGSGADALLCRYKSGRRALDADDQITLEWAGVYRHYHAALMRTVCIGKATPRHIDLHGAASEALSEVEATIAPGRTAGDVFEAHAGVLDRHGLASHRLAACGYSLGARFTPSWMDWPMFYAGNPWVLEPGMVMFAHMIIMDSDTGTAMCLGRTSLVTENGSEPLSKAPLDLMVK